MSALRLSPAEQIAFGRAALQLRYESEESPITADQVITPRRQADTAADIWSTMNRTQENLIRGGLNYVQRSDSGRIVARRQTRPINGIDQNTNLNRALWTLAEEMQKIKTA
jgi:hypothetical protein